MNKVLHKPFQLIQGPPGITNYYNINFVFHGKVFLIKVLEKVSLELT